MVAPAVEAVMETDCADVYVPAPGWIEGAARTGSREAFVEVAAPPPPPQPMPERIRDNERAIAAAMFTVRGNPYSLLRDCMERRAAEMAASRIMATHGEEGRSGEEGMGENGATWDAPRVLTEIVKETAPPLEMGRLPGTVQAAPKGTPEQLKESVPLKPAPGMA